MVLIISVDFLYFSQDSEYDGNLTPFQIIKEDFYDLENSLNLSANRILGT